MFTVNYRNTRAMCEICSKLTIKPPERRHGVSIVCFEQVNAHCKWWQGNTFNPFPPNVHF